MKRRGCAPATSRRLSVLAAHMEDLKRFGPAEGPTHLPDDDELALSYLGGLFTGEGHIGLGEDRARAIIKMRADDQPLLEEIRDRFGIGRVYVYPAYGPGNPCAQWVVFSRDDLACAVSIFEQAALRGRKARQFEAWKQGVQHLVTAQATGSAIETAAFRDARRRLELASRYSPASAHFASGRAHALAAEAYVEILRAWAKTTPRPLTCTAYDAARRAYPVWPNRNTITLTFGSWAEALDAAGLRHRAHARSAA